MSHGTCCSVKEKIYPGSVQLGEQYSVCMVGHCGDEPAELEPQTLTAMSGGKWPNVLGLYCSLHAWSAGTACLKHFHMLSQQGISTPL